MHVEKTWKGAIRGSGVRRVEEDLGDSVIVISLKYRLDFPEV